MSPYTIAVLVGSLRRESYNQRLANAIVRMAPAEFLFHQARIDDLPFYNPDDEANPAESVKRFRDELRAAQGLLFVTPEYNRSIPAVLKNALDQGSRPRGQSVWAGKPAGLIGVSTGAIGTALAQQHLRSILVNLDVAALAQPEIYIQFKEGLFDDAGGIGPASLQFLQTWMDKYVAWVKKHTA